MLARFPASYTVKVPFTSVLNIYLSLSYTIRETDLFYFYFFNTGQLNEDG